jgi:hypothetical protein
MSAPGIQYSTNFPALVDLDPILSEIFYQNLPELDESLEMFFNVLGSTKSKETDLRIGSFGDPLKFTGQIVYDSASPDSEVEYVHTEYAKGYMVERRLSDDDQYQVAFKGAGDMNRAFRRKVHKDRSSVFVNAFSGSFLGYDSKALCANDHPRSSNDATAVDNLATSALSPSGLDTVRQQGEALVDDRGELFEWDGDLLVVPNELWKTAMELSGSPQEINTAENQINVFEGLTVVRLKRLTDANAWFLIDSELMKQSLKWYWRVQPEFSSIEDFESFVMKYRGYMRYSFGWSDFRWIVGSNPS